MEWEAAFDRLTEELEPYHEFLRYGYLSADVDDPDEWRGEIRRQARRDGIPMRSFVLGEPRDGRYHVWAGKFRDADDGALHGVMALMGTQEEASERASLLGHERIRWLRVSRGEEAAGRCPRCGGRVYVSRLNAPPVIDGDVFNSDCY